MSKQDPVKRGDAGHHCARAGLVLLALLIIFACWRATRETTLNCDDVYTLVLIHHRPAEVIDLTMIDLHPPGYYLVLKAWVKLGRVFMDEPGVFWARMPGLIGMLLTMGVSLSVGRRLCGLSGGVLLTLAIAVSAQAASFTQVLRSYALGIPAATICFLLMLAIHARVKEPGGRVARLWFGYGIAASAALWTHLLTGIIVFLLGLGWCLMVAGVVRREGAGRTLRSPFVIGGAITQALVVIGYFPWLLHLQHQLGTLAGPRRDWLTPTTLANYWNVFFLWYAWGPIGGTAHIKVPALWQAVVGSLTVLIPGAVCMARRAKGAATKTAGLMAAMGLSIGLLNVAFLWGSDRLGAQHLFAGTRYTVFSSAIWGAGVAGLALWGARGRPVVAWVLIAPWIVVNLAGQAIESKAASKNWLEWAMEDAAGPMPDRESELFVMPEALVPFFRRTLSGYRVPPASAMLEGEAGSMASMLQINMWSDIDLDRDKVLQGILRTEKVFSDVERINFPTWAPSWNQFAMWRMSGIDGLAAARVREAGLEVRTRRPPTGAMLSVDARALHCRDGWNALGVGDELIGMRWSRMEKAKVRLGGALEAGEYEIELNIVRNEAPGTTTTLHMGLEGEGWSEEIALRSGWQSLRVRAAATRRHDEAVVVLEHPVIRLQDYNPAATDPRPLGILFYDLAVFPAMEGTK